MKSGRILFLFVLLFCTTKTFAQFLQYSNDFLNIGAGARGLAMGNAQVASVSDATAGYWNPAALVHIQDHPSLSLMHADYFSGIGQYEYAGLAIPTQNPNRTLGINFVRFAIDDIPNTLFLVNPDGSIDYNNISSFSSADYALLFSYAQRVNRSDFDLSYGGNAKIIYRKVGSFAQAWGFGFDAAVQIKKGNWQLGLVARDVTTTFNAWSFSFTDQEKQILYLTQNDIPVKSTEMTAPHLLAGVAYNFQFTKKLSLLTEADVSATFNGQQNTLVSTKAFNLDPCAGLELSISKIVFIRGGVSNFQRALSDGDTTDQKKVWIFQPSIGCGVKLKDVYIDYAYSNLANQSNPLHSNIFSVRIDLVGTKKK